MRSVDRIPTLSLPLAEFSNREEAAEAWATWLQVPLHETAELVLGPDATEQAIHNEALMLLGCIIPAFHEAWQEVEAEAARLGI